MNAPAEKSLSVRTGRQQRLLRRTTLLALVIPALGLAGYFGWQKFHASGNELEQYQLATVQRGDIEDLVTATGTMQPREYVDVGAQVSGQLKKIHVEIGSVVEAGALLAEIDPTVFRANVDARRALLRNQQANLGDRESQLALAELQHARQKSLMTGDATTIESLQAAEATMRSAKAQVSAIQAQIEQTESTLRADEANLDYARIYAPISGVVVSVTARQGQTLNANQQAPNILRIADLSTMTVQTQVSEADVGRLQPDMDVYFTTLGSRGRRWYGNLRKVEPTPTVTNNVVLYNALFDVPNAQRNLLPQMTAQVFFVAATAKDSLFVPASAVSMHRAERRGREGEERQAADGRPAAAPMPSGTGPSAASTREDAATPPRAAEPKQGTAPVAVPVGQAGDTRRERHPDEGGARRPAEARTARLPRDERPGAEVGTALRGTPAWQAMSREERRAAFERMSPEEREALRERRRTERAAEAGTGAEESVLLQPGERRRGSPERGKEPRHADGRNASPPTAAAAPVWAGVAPLRPRGPREGTVKVVTTEGRVEERKVQVGISNRIQIQVLSGLTEGEQVVAGVKPPPGAPRSPAQRNALQAQGGNGLAGAPGTSGGGQGGRGR